MDSYLQVPLPLERPSLLVVLVEPMIKGHIARAPYHVLESSMRSRGNVEALNRLIIGNYFRKKLNRLADFLEKGHRSKHPFDFLPLAAIFTRHLAYASTFEADLIVV
jgi:hypothetical protein